MGPTIFLIYILPVVFGLIIIVVIGVCTFFKRSKSEEVKELPDVDKKSVIVAENLCYESNYNEIIANHTKQDTVPVTNDNDTKSKVQQTKKTRKKKKQPRRHSYVNVIADTTTHKKGKPKRKLSLSECKIEDLPMAGYDLAKNVSRDNLLDIAKDCKLKPDPIHSQTTPHTVDYDHITFNGDSAKKQLEKPPDGYSYNKLVRQQRENTESRETTTNSPCGTYGYLPSLDHVRVVASEVNSENQTTDFSSQIEDRNLKAEDDYDHVTISEQTITITTAKMK